MTKFLQEHKSLVFFAVGCFLSQMMAILLPGMPVAMAIIVAVPGTLLPLALYWLVNDDFPEDKPMRRTVVNIGAVVASALMAILLFAVLSSPPSLHTFFDGDVSALPPVLVAAAQDVLARMPQASFFRIQATLGLFAALAAFGGVLAAGRHLHIVRTSTIFTAALASLCAMIGVGTLSQMSSLPAPCELAQQAYAHAQTLSPDDVATLKRLDCRVNSTYAIQAVGPLSIGKNKDR